jgi:PHD/YefM family antitoxin component YafN of YafNO toxin-antitoxin module
MKMGGGKEKESKWMKSKFLNRALRNEVINERRVKMLIKEENLQYIYQKNKKKGVILDIQTFEALMEMLEDYEDGMDFEVLKTEETIDYKEYRKSRMKQDVRD